MIFPGSAGLFLGGEGLYYKTHHRMQKVGFNCFTMLLKKLRVTTSSSLSAFTSIWKSIAKETQGEMEAKVQSGISKERTWSGYVHDRLQSVTLDMFTIGDLLEWQIKRKEGEGLPAGGVLPIIVDGPPVGSPFSTNKKRGEKAAGERPVSLKICIRAAVGSPFSINENKGM